MLTFDELNRLNRNAEQRSMDIEDYFDEMELEDDERQDRKECAEKMHERIFFFLALLYILLTENELQESEQETKLRIENELTDILKEYTYPDYMETERVRKYASDFVDATARRFEKFRDEPEKLAYWFSDDRARLNAEEEVNTIFNHEQYRNAIDIGFKYKQWITMKDERVRPTHAEVDDLVVPIGQPFIVGGYPMEYPRDDSLGAPVSEIAGCRCSVEYY